MGTCGRCGVALNEIDVDYEDLCQPCIDALEDDDEFDEFYDIDEPDDDSITTEDHRRFYQYGKLYLELGEDDDHKASLRAKMDEDRFWPDVFFVSDHGNTVLLDLGSED